MRNTVFKSTAALMLCLCLSGVSAQTLYVLKFNGIQTSYSIGEINKLYFSSGYLYIDQMYAPTDEFPLAEVRYLNFEDYTGTTSPEMDNPRQLLLYPNPVKGSFTIQYHAAGNEVVSIKILSTDGRMIYQQSLHVTEGWHTMQADGSSWPQGMYVCLLETKASLVTKKFIKL